MLLAGILELAPGATEGLPARHLGAIRNPLTHDAAAGNRGLGAVWEVAGDEGAPRLRDDRGDLGVRAEGGRW